MSELGPLGVLREAAGELDRGLRLLRTAEDMCVRDSSEQWMQREEAERQRDRYREALEAIAGWDFTSEDGKAAGRTAVRALSAASGDPDDRFDDMIERAAKAVWDVERQDRPGRGAGMEPPWGDRESGQTRRYYDIAQAAISAAFRHPVARETTPPSPALEQGRRTP